MKVLIAEDDALSRRVLERAVQQLGHTTTVVADGDAAWDALQADAPDLIISDWMMPGLSGLDLCRKVRSHMRTTSCYIYFIVLTALAERDHFLKAMEADADDFLTKPLDRTDLQARLRVAGRVTSLYQEVAHKNSELETQKAEVERLNEILYRESRTDALTGLANRLRLDQDLAVLKGRVDRYGHKYAVVLFDIDNFKKYNDRYGHPAGDDVLRRVAGATVARIRKSDVAYRYGGEEFAVVLPEQPPGTARVVADHLRQAVAGLEIAHPGNEPYGIVTMSAGVDVITPGETKTIEELLQRADEALYRAKERGRNHVCVAP
jgi:diguanylate cyclase (GGDEF)-like protein